MTSAKKIYTLNEAIDARRIGYSIPNMGQTFSIEYTGTLYGSATTGKGMAFWKFYSNRWYERSGTIADLQKWLKKNKAQLVKK